MEKEQIRNLMFKHLSESFSLFKEYHKIQVHVLNSEDICIGYRTNREKSGELRGTTHFDIQLIKDTCYILDIELEKDKRGIGIGRSLYETIHKFAKSFGAKKVRQTPSGWTAQGKTRREYLLKRGYVPFGKDELELIL